MAKRLLVLGCLAVTLLVLVACAGRGVSISLSPSEVTLAPGEALVFTATVMGSANKGVTWESSGGELVPSGMTAVFTAPAELGEYTVTVTSAGDRGRWASAAVTVEGIVDDGDGVSAVTDATGGATFDSLDGSTEFDVVTRSESGDPISGVVVSFSQRPDGTPVFLVVDPSGYYAPLFVLGTPASASTSTVAHGLEGVSPSAIVVLVDMILTVGTGAMTLEGSGLAVQEITAFGEWDRVPCNAQDGAICVCKSVADIASMFHAQAVHDWRFGKLFMSAMVFTATSAGGVPLAGIAYSSLDAFGVVPEALAADIISYSGALGWTGSLTPEDRLLVTLLDYQAVDVPERVPQAWSTMIISGEVCNPAFDGIYQPGSLVVSVDPPSPTYGQPVTLRVHVSDVQKANAGVVLSIRSGDHSFERVLTAKPNASGDVVFTVPSHNLAPISGKQFDDFVVAVGGTSLVAVGRYEWQGSPERLGPIVRSFVAEPMVSDEATTIRFKADVRRHDGRPITCELHTGISGRPGEVWDNCMSLTKTLTVVRSVAYPKGMFTARFVVRDADGGYDVLYIPITVGRPGDRNTPPVLQDLHWSPAEPVIGEAVQFYWRARDANGDVALCRFNPGDGSFAFEVSLSSCLGLGGTTFAGVPYVYDRPGDFVAELYARDGAGAEASISRPVRVLGVGTLDVAISGLPAGVGAHVTVSGPRQFRRTLDRTTRLLLPEGTYEITAMPAGNLISGPVYNPTPITQQVTVVHGGNRVAPVAYELAGPSVVVSVEPSPVTLAPGQKETFTAIVSGVADTRVTWTPPSCGTIAPAGNSVVFTAGTVSATCFLTATSVAQPSASGSARITVSSALGNVFMSVNNVGGVPTEGVTVTLTGTGGTFSAVSDAVGIAEILGVPAGEYAADVWLLYEEAAQFPLRDEYWGSRSVTVVALSSAAPSFTRGMPYMTAGLDFPSSVTSGTPVTVTNNVVNPSARSVRARLLVDRADCTPAGCSTTGVVGSSVTGSSVGVSVTPTGTGAYRFYLALETNVSGTWRVTDQLAGFGFAFNVTDPGGGFEPTPSYISISNVSLAAASGGTRRVNFDISWPESWRGPSQPSWVVASDNWDAAWVFVKYRVSGGPWQHATLAASGHVQPPGSVVSVPGDRRGAFVYRGSGGYGTFTANGVGLAWDYVADGVAAGASVDVQPFAIEMVYVPEGSFSVGSGGTSTGEFRAGGTVNTPFVVSSQSSIALGSTSGQLMWTAAEMAGSPSGSTNAGFPTGYGPFYVMKYQISQGQYVNFLNALTQAQADARKHTGSDYRFAVTGSSVGSYATLLPFVAMNYISWADGAAFADWAGLRPLSELEFEKAARGPLGPVANEFAWGSTSITQATGLANAGTITETPTPAGANAAHGNASGVQGPVRVGSFAVPGRLRRDAGAGFYGALELSGNLWERPVTAGNAEGRAFTGTHGDGTLDGSGNANVSSWPGSTAVGAGLRGGSWYSGGDGLRVSNRLNAANTLASRNIVYGWRGARSAP